MSIEEEIFKRTQVDIDKMMDYGFKKEDFLVYVFEKYYE